MKQFAAGMVTATLVAAGWTQPSLAQDKSKDGERLTSASAVIEEVMGTPDRAIPRSILAGASCVVVIPSYKKGAFLVGAQ